MPIQASTGHSGIPFRWLTFAWLVLAACALCVCGVQAFVKESAHLSDSSSETLHLMLSSQMFERFIEERIANANHPQVTPTSKSQGCQRLADAAGPGLWPHGGVQIKFFDESINAKLNRAKTQLVKKETPFLDDSTDQVSHLQHALSGGRHGSRLVM